MNENDELHNPQPHQAPAKHTVSAVLDKLISAGDNLVTLLGGLLAALLILYSGYVIYDNHQIENQAFSGAWEVLQYKPELFQDGRVSLSQPGILEEINRDYRAWLTVYAAPDAVPGVYAGSVKVCGDGGAKAYVPVTVMVGGAILPKTFSTWNSFSVMDGFTRMKYKDRFKEMKRASWDMMLEHRLSPDDISRFAPPDIDDLLYARERGMNLFNILNIVPPPKDPNTPIVYNTTSDVLFSDWFYPSFRDRVVKYVAELKRHGLEKMAYIYGFDEQGKEFYPAIDMFWRNLKRDVPGIPLMSTSFAYRDMAEGVTNLTPTARSCDWFCPCTHRWKPSLSEKLRKEGKKVWWYTCCSPVYPYANFASLEYPFIEGRLIGWMTHLYRADGFLFWVVNFWTKKNAVPDESDTYLMWDSSISNNRNGDGVLMYPGKDHILPSIRLANVRDGIEDGELLKMFAEKGRAAEAESACRKLVTDLKNFSRDPAALRSAREPLLKE